MLCPSHRRCINGDRHGGDGVDGECNGSSAKITNGGARRRCESTGITVDGDTEVWRPVSLDRASGVEHVRGHEAVAGNGHNIEVPGQPCTEGLERHTRGGVEDLRSWVEDGAEAYSFVARDEGHKQVHSFG